MCSQDFFFFVLKKEFDGWSVFLSLPGTKFQPMTAVEKQFVRCVFFQVNLFANNNTNKSDSFDDRSYFAKELSSKRRHDQYPQFCCFLCFQS